MGNLFQELDLWGAATREGLKRVFNDEAFYRELLDEFAGDPELDLLIEKIEAGAYRDAFFIAHKQKGAAMTLGMKPMELALSDLTEDLRGEVQPTLSVHLATYRTVRGEFGRIMSAKRDS